MFSRILPALFLLSLLPLIRAAEPAPPASGVTSANNDRLRKGLERFPEADANHDGVLTLEEARPFLKKMNLSEDLALGTKPETAKAKASAPTLADVKYGPFERNVLDFWKAPSATPAPVVVYIHGGGFRAGDKSGVRSDKIVRQCLEAGVSFAAINYRYRTTAPLPEVLRDCARAVQFIRSKSSEWNVDKTRLAAYGGSAGAGTSLWLAFHDDLADPKNPDPVLRESTRLSCAGAQSCQFSYDVFQWPTVFREEVCRRFTDPADDWPAFYGVKSAEELNGPVGLKVRQDCDMCRLITRDDPPVFLSTSLRGGEVTDRNHYLHHPKHAETVKQRCDEIGVGCVAVIPASQIAPPAGGPRDLREFLFQHLGVKTPEGTAP